MKNFSLLKATVLFLVVMIITASLLQCKKEDGLIINKLDRSFTGTADTTIYAAFYESNVVVPSDPTPDVNDIIKFRSVQTIIHEYCATSNCHGGPISPKFDTYAQVMSFITAGNPSTSKLWEYITTNDFKKAMPPVNSNHELNSTDKTLIFNWITNGAKERPNLADFRPAAVFLINRGCGSANCHNQATATGSWARAGFLGPLTNADTTTFNYINPQTGVLTTYTQLSNVSLRNQVWNAYKDSVRKFYSDTVAFANFRPWKTFSTPRSFSNTRGPLQTYDDLLLDINYPKSIRSYSSTQGPVYVDPVTNIKYYVKGNPLIATSSLVSRIDSTLVLAPPAVVPAVFATSHQGDMAYGDGGLKSHEIALIKAWYFADPNVPAVWKYGPTNAGIFKYRNIRGYIIKP